MAEIVIAFGPFYVDQDPGLSVICGVMAGGPNWHLWSRSVRENLLAGGIYMVVGSAEASVVILGLLPLSGVL